MWKYISPTCILFLPFLSDLPIYYFIIADVVFVKCLKRTCTCWKMCCWTGVKQSCWGLVSNCMSYKPDRGSKLFLSLQIFTWKWFGKWIAFTNNQIYFILMLSIASPGRRMQHYGTLCAHNKGFQVKAPQFVQQIPLLILLLFVYKTPTRMSGWQKGRGMRAMRGAAQRSCVTAEPFSLLWSATAAWQCFKRGRRRHITG